MKHFISRFVALAIMSVLIGGAIACAQTETIVMARIAMRNFATEHYFEVIEERGRRAFPDAYYIDFGSNRYREAAIGGGGDLYRSARMTITQEVYIDQAFGSEAHRALYLVPWTRIAYAIRPKVHSEIVYFPYLPLNHAGRIQNVIERAKAEYFFQHFKLGAGYGAYQYGDNDWEEKPFVTATIRTQRMGELEFWLQRIPGNHLQAQIRYRVVIKKKR